MPELPEVETVKETLKRKVLNKTIKDVRVIYPNIIENVDTNTFINNLKNLGAEIVYINDFYNGYYSFNDKSFCYDFNQYLKGTTGTIRSLSHLLASKKYVSDMSWVSMNWCNSDYTNSSEYKQSLTARNSYTTYVKNKFNNNKVDIVIKTNNNNVFLNLLI